MPLWLYAIESEVAGRPAVHERVRVDAGHAPLGHLGELEVREEGQLGKEDRIEVRILGRGAAVGVEQRQRFMQVVDDRGMRGEVPVGNRAHRDLRQVDVAIVVVEDVFAPVRHAWSAASPATATTTSARALGSVGIRLLAGASSTASGGLSDLQLEIAVEPVHVAIASVRIGDRRDRDVHVVADLVDEGRRLGRQPVGELHQHLGGTGFTAVESPHQVVVWLRRRDELTDLLGGARAGVGDAREVLAVVLQIRDVRVRRNPDHHELSILVGPSDRLDPHASRHRGREGLVVLQDVRVVGQFGGGADVVAEHVLRSRHAADLRQVIDQRAQEVRLRRPRLHRRGEIVVLGLRRVPRFGDHLLRRQRHGRDDEGRCEKKGPAPGGQTWHVENSCRRPRVGRIL